MKTDYMYGKTQDEAYRPECVGQQGRNVRISDMFWGCVTYSGVGTLVPIAGNMNLEKYIETLDQNLWSVIFITIWKFSIYIPG